MYPLRLSLRSLRTNFLFSSGILLSSSLNSYLSLVFHVFSFQYDYRLILCLSPSLSFLPHQHVSPQTLSAELEHKFSLLLLHLAPFIFKLLSISAILCLQEYIPIVLHMAPYHKATTNGRHGEFGVINCETFKKRLTCSCL